jgi:uncharacterized membrane protein YdjX (TVP38/TMEM64 family)
MDDFPVPNAKTGTLGRIVLLAAVVAAVVAAYLALGGDQLIERLSRHEADLAALRESQPAVVYAGALVAYTVVAALLPLATGMTLVYGWFFGLVVGVILVSFASTAAATLSMLISRYLLRDVIEQRFGKQLKRANNAMEREGAFYLFAARLIPVFPFFVINVVMGLTNVRAWTFWWVSQLGMLPGTVAYVLFGSQLPSLATLSEEGVSGVVTPGLLAAFALLGIVPLLAKNLLSRMQSHRQKITE